MTELTPEGRRLVDELAQRHGVSSDAVLTLLRAVAAGNGASAQFNHPELGGMGQWSQGGMIMVGDMFNNALKHRVDMLCSELSALVRNQPLHPAAPSQSQSQSQSSGFAHHGLQGQTQSGAGYRRGVSLFVPGSGSSMDAWWPSELGVPSSTGAQNSIRYACFPTTRRLAIQIDGRVTVYDTLDHQIAGFSQQQSGDASLTFTSQHGLVRVADLPVVPTGRAGPPSTRAGAETRHPWQLLPPSPRWSPRRRRLRHPSPPARRSPVRPAPPTRSSARLSAWPSCVRRAPSRRRSSWPRRRSCYPASDSRVAAPDRGVKPYGRQADHAGSQAEHDDAGVDVRTGTAASPLYP